MSSLGYDGISGYLLFTDDTSVFATGTAGATFVHGGNSLQERVIPVLTVTRKQREVVGFAQYNVEVQPDTDVLGLHRIRVRVVLSDTSTARLGFATAGGVDLALRVPEREGIRGVIKDVAKPGELRAGRLRIPVGDAWTEVFFGLEGPSDERVQVEVYHPDSVERVREAKTESWFAVSGTARTVAAASVPPPAAPATWVDAIADEGTRRVFLHIQKHGVISELEVADFLVTRSAMRRFTLEFDVLLEKLPFKVRTETSESGKRYVRDA